MADDTPAHIATHPLPRSERLSYAPFIAYGAYGGRLPNSRLILWPVRAAHLVFTIAIPVTIWIALHGLPCPPNCGPGT